MKNHIVFKFIAILLCAAALLGVLGSAGGILVMIEAELYEKNVTQAYRETLESYATGYASEIAVRYASRELGGARDAQLENYYGSNWYNDVFHQDRVGYVITDADGNILASQEIPSGALIQEVFKVPASGRYMQTHHILTEEEYFGTVELPEGTSTDNALGHVYNAIPEDGADIYYMEMRYSNGTAETIGSPEDYLGTIYATPEGAAEFYGAEGLNLLENSHATTIPTWPSGPGTASWSMRSAVMRESSRRAGTMAAWSICCCGILPRRFSSTMPSPPRAAP